LKFGVGIPTCREGLYFPPNFASPSKIIEIAKVAEELGFYSIWGNDHFTTPKYVTELWREPPNFYEPMVTLSYLAAVTKKVRLAIGVAILPIRNPVILAKEVATLDVLSGGRFILAVGLGAYREEFKRVHPAMAGVNRGILLDESLCALQELLTQPKASFNGQYIKFNDIEIHPKPIQDPFPIYIGGGFTDKNLKRVAEMGQGWFPSGMKPEYISEGISKIKKYASIMKRDVSKIDIAPQYTISIAKTHDEAMAKYTSTALYAHHQTISDEREKYARSQLRARSNINTPEGRDLIGTPSEIIEKLDQLSKAGVTHPAALIFASRNGDEMLEGMEIFSKEVIPSFD